MRSARFFAGVLASLGMLASLSPAWASVIPVPEPSTMGIFAVGAGAAYLLNRYLRK